MTVSSPSSLIVSPGLQEATRISTEEWRKDLEELFLRAKDRFPDVVWEVCEEDEEQEPGARLKEVWGHKAMVYARAPPSFQNRYFSLRGPNAPYSSSPTLPTTSAISLDLDRSIEGGNGRTPSPYHMTSPVPSTVPQQSSGLLRIRTCNSPALFSKELEYLYTGQGFSEAFEFIFDSSSELVKNRNDLDAEELRIDKLRKDFVFMWRSRLYSDVQLSLTGNFSTSAPQEHSTAIFSSHRFILVSRSPYFHSALLSWPSNKPPPSSSAPQVLNLPSPPFTPASLHFTLGFIYTGTLVFSHRTYDLTTAFAILRAALYLSLPTLHTEIQARIIQEMCHGLFHAFLPFPEYDSLTNGAWGTGGCRCRQCARRAPRVLEFALAGDVNNAILERGARRALVGIFGEGWCTPEFATLPAKIRDSLLRGLSKRTTVQNALALLSAAEHALKKLSSIIDPWARDVNEMVLMARKTVDEVICTQMDECLAGREWEEIVERDGVAFDDAERVEWIMGSVTRGVSEKNAPILYQTLVSNILLRPHPTDPNQPLLSSTSHIRVQVEQTRLDLLKWIGRRWLNIRQEGAFDSLEGWALKEISDHIEQPTSDLLSTASTRNTPHKSSTPGLNLRHSQGPRHSTLLRAKENESTDSISIHSSMRVNVLARSLTQQSARSPTISRPNTQTSSAASFKSLTPRSSTVSMAESVRAGVRARPQKPDSRGARPDSKLTPAHSLSGDQLPPYESLPGSPTSTTSTSLFESPIDNNGSADYDQEDDDRSTLGDQGDEDMEDDEPDHSPSPPPSVTSTLSKGKVVIRRVTPSGSSTTSRTKPTQPGGPGPRPSSSAASIRSTRTVSSARSHASTIRNGSATSAAPRVVSTKSTTRTTPASSTSTRTRTTPVATRRGASPSNTTSTPSTTTSGDRSSPTFHTANSNASLSPATPQVRARRLSSASTRSVATNVSVRAGKPTEDSAPTRPGSKPASGLGPVGSTRTRKTSASSAKSFNLSAPPKRPALPPLDTNKVSPGIGKRPVGGSAASSLRTGPSNTSGTSKGGVSRKRPAPATETKGKAVEKEAEVEKEQNPPSHTEDVDMQSSTSEDESPQSNEDVTITMGAVPSVIRPPSQEVIPLSLEHRKTDSNTSTGSGSTLRRRGSNETITTRFSGGTATAPIAHHAPGSTGSGPGQTGASPPGPLAQEKDLPSLPPEPPQPKGATLEIGIPCIISSHKKRFKAYARYIGEVVGEYGPWVGVEVPIPSGGASSGDSGWGSNFTTSGPGSEFFDDGDRQWNDGSWGGVRYFDISNGMESESDYGSDERLGKKHRVDWTFSSGNSSYRSRPSRGGLKREGDQLSVENAKRFRSASPAMSDVSATESRGLFIRPQQVLYVVDAHGPDL